MKILISNYRFFLSGGPERYMFNVMTELNKINHTTVPFSIKYSANKRTIYSNFFAPPLGKEDEVYFHQQRIRINTVFRSISRLFYSFEVKNCAYKLIENEKPDIAYILNYLRKLSPSLLVAIKKASIPIVVRISDYAMLCPQAHCLRNNEPCQLCFSGNLWHSLRYKCLQNSYSASLLNTIATIYHRKKKFFDLIDCFVVTNPFMYQLMELAGYPADRLRLIPTFVDTSFFKPSIKRRRNHFSFIYSGRLEYIKGVHVILEALGKLRHNRPNLRWHMAVAGKGDSEYLTFIKSLCSYYRINDSVSFLGQLGSEALATALSSAHIGIVPSLWYENLPNALLECFASGLPVIASNIGSLPYCVENNRNGILFPTGNSEKLSEVLIFCLENPQIVSTMARHARIAAKKIYSRSQHISKLLALFSELIGHRKHR